MTRRDDKLYEEAVALWRELYNEPPPDRADGAMLLHAITGGLPFKSYDRMTSVHLRASNIAGPGQPTT